MAKYAFEGRVALVTGAGSGIGRAAAIGFARSGAAVLVSDVNVAGGEETVAQIAAAGGKALFQRCDVSNPHEAAAMVACAVEAFGGLDFAYNNAGINDIAADEFEDAVWARSLAVNLTGVMNCMRAESEVMLTKGKGAIVNTSSINGVIGNAAQPAYTAAKHGVIGLTRSAALRWAKSGIRVNAVCPGIIDTPMAAQAAQNPEARRIIETITPMARMGKAEEIAAAAIWLCSDEASFVTGQPLVVDGGVTAF
ncbi:SDR family NAD(P)-dependent oxidoreductase [Novosphingobium sp. KACC 22771]|uniref:SDR family NAD(P)-dependent oxidoreductase n=1 Tax=Novosphingobium sp. KACC 22771 TaxID=3025670 RepID=UPI0023650594|nr:SDR family NAD(P)-dependent oxidoreductase [Novosphingobium sp. KACC 22771]WDF74274.1 SDR family NAD(P)-dependent oxidoreductase [Novosphingobium sp. KACC 22771]